MPLGLVSSENLDDYWFQNTRRSVFYSYPNGTAPLTGFMSLADTRFTPQPQFGWNEERWTQTRTTTVAGPTANTGFYLGGTTTTAGATFTPTLGTAYRLYVTAADEFQTDDVVKVFRLSLNSGGAFREVSLRVTSVNSATSPYYLEVIGQNTLDGAVTNNSATVGTVGLQLVYSGTAFAEGSRSRRGGRRFPVEIQNYTQIFKRAFEVTGTALKENLKYDKEGGYKSLLKTNGITLMEGMEIAFLWGDRTSTTAVDDDTGDTVSRRTTGGLLWFLKQWELGTVSNGGAFNYRPTGSADLTAQTDWNVYTEKRIIRLGGAAISKTQFDEIEALPFQKTNSTQFCKLCLAGSGYISKMNATYERMVQKTELRGEKYEGWDFMVTRKDGLQGEIYYKNHPLMNTVEHRNSAFYIDLGYIQHRHVTDRDMDIMENIQHNDADKRKDQYLAETGLELIFPEAHMYVEALGGITAG